MLDTAVPGGAIIGGSGSPAYVGDIEVSGGRVAAVDGVADAVRTEIDAETVLVG